MKLGISNLAWSDEIDLQTLIWILQDNNVSYIEVVIPRYLDWHTADLTALCKFTDYIRSRGLNITTTQAICYNVPVRSFADNAFIEHINKVSNICDKIGVKSLVLGAPKLRALIPENVLQEVLLVIGNILKARDQVLLLEPNSRYYKGEFFYKVGDIVNFLNSFTADNINTMLDTHNSILEQERPVEIFNKYSDYIKHIHVSEQDLKGYTVSKEHQELAEALKYQQYDGLIVYEAKPTLQLEKDIQLFTKTYNL